MNYLEYTDEAASSVDPNDDYYPIRWILPFFDKGANFVTFCLFSYNNLFWKRVCESTVFPFWVEPFSEGKQNDFVMELALLKVYPEIVS